MSQEKYQHLFDIANTISSNHVEFSACEKGDSFSLEVSWHNKEGQKTRNLNALEKTFGYGGKITHNKKKNTNQITIAAFRSRKIDVIKNDQGQILPVATINGHRAILTRIWVEVSQGHLLIPKVHYIDVFGTDLQTGENVQERITKKK